MTTDAADDLRRERKIVFGLLWLTYASFYLCRLNFSAAIPLIQRDFDLTNIETGRIMGALLIAYGIGQFVNGALADRFGVRVVVFLGMMGSVLANVMFGFAGGVAAMVALWSLNGYFQSVGWPGVIRVSAHWFPSESRGRMLGLLATSYQFGNIASWLISSLLVGWLALSFRSLFIVPSILMAAVAIFFVLRVRESPETERCRAPYAERAASLRDLFAAMFSQRGVWFIAFAYLFLCVVRFGFLTWAIDYLSSQGGGVGAATLKASIIPAGGCLGTIAAGWISDRFFRCRRAPVAILFLVSLALLIVLFAWSGRGVPVQIALLLAIGFTIHGPEMLIVSASAADLGKKIAATASGFINSMGHIGAIAQTFLTPYFRYNFGLKGAYGFWAVCAIIAALMMLFVLTSEKNAVELQRAGAKDTQL